MIDQSYYLTVMPHLIPNYITRFLIVYFLALNPSLSSHAPGSRFASCEDLLMNVTAVSEGASQRGIPKGSAQGISINLFKGRTALKMGCVWISFDNLIKYFSCFKNLTVYANLCIHEWV